MPVTFSRKCSFDDVPGMRDTRACVRTAKRAVQTVERIFVTLEPNCRTIVLNPTYRRTLPRRENAKPLQFEAFPMMETGGLDPRPLT